MKKLILTSFTVFGLAVFATGASASSHSYSLFGDADIVSPGNASANAAQTRSTATDEGFGGVDLTPSDSSLTFGDLNTLGTDYMVTDGICAGGSPRFSLATPEGNIFVYLGTPPNYSCVPGVWQNTGNLLEAADFVDTSQVGGTFYDTVANAQAQYGDLVVTDIDLVTDASWAVPGGTQTVVFDNVMVNSDVFTFESAPTAPTTKDQCKDGGWMTFGTFKNQGQCVSSVAKNK